MLLIAVGLVALIVGAEFIVRSGTQLAARLGMPPMVIGLTVVAIGTSTPELAVGIEAALGGVGDLAVGNIAGTNIVNLLLILGLSALIKPLAIHGRTLRIDLPMMALTALALVALSADLSLTLRDGWLLLIIAVVYTFVIVLASRGETLRIIRSEYAMELGSKPNGAVAAERPGPSGGSTPPMGVTPRRSQEVRAIAFSLGVLLAAIAVTLVGADWLVRGSLELAAQFGVSDVVIGLTIVAIGTSAPELATTILSTFRHHRDIAIGNLIGSSVYNIALILGVTILAAREIPIAEDLARVDIPLMALATLVCIPVFLSGRRMTRIEGGLFVLAYGVYLAFLVLVRS